MTNTKPKKILIGVAWPYVNGDLHPGHIAGNFLPADIFARFARLKGNQVLMISGTDCYGTPITIEADKKGVAPQEIVDIYNPRTHKLMEDYKISFDLFTQTTTENHKEIVQEFFVRLAHNGYLIKQKSLQYYSESDNKFLPDRYVEGECPHCHAKEQRSDQCENCGRSLQQGELIEAYSKLTKSPVILKETEHYFLDLKKFESELKKYVEKSGKSWRNWVYKEAESWLKEGLEQRSITRDLDWGIEIPTERLPENLRIENAENKRIYVWFDAVIGYFSASVEWAKQNSESISGFWEEDHKSVDSYHFMGKDNLFFHTLWWQSILLGQDKDLSVENSTYKLPDIVTVNQWLNLEGQKFSKSRGIYIDNNKLIEEFGLDIVRFYLASIMPENSDANWKWDDFQATINSELNGNIGNFIHRTLTFYKNKLVSDVIPGVVPQSGTETRNPEDLPIKEENQQLDTTPITFIGNSIKRISNPAGIVEVKLNEGLKSLITYYFNTNFSVPSSLESCQFKEAINLVLELSAYGNKYFDHKAPWKSLKENRDDCEKTIYNCIQIVNALRILLHPFTPDASDRLSDMLGLERLPSRPGENAEFKDYFQFDEEEIKKAIQENLIGTGQYGQITPLFGKIDPEQIEKFTNQ